LSTLSPMATLRNGTSVILAAGPSDSEPAAAGPYQPRRRGAVTAVSIVK
jgi:hypothetical protein